MIFFEIFIFSSYIGRVKFLKRKTMDKKVLIFLPFSSQKNVAEKGQPDLEMTRLSTSCELQEIGEVYIYKDIQGNNVKEFIQKKIEELGPDWVVAEGNGATALLELKFPNSIMINPKVDYGSLGEVTKEVKDNSFGYFGMHFEKDYELFQSVYPNSAWYPAAEISVLSLKSTIETIVNCDEEW